VRLIESYDEISPDPNSISYDILVLSRVFKFTSIPTSITNLIERGYIYYGGTGFFEIDGPDLPEDVEHHKPDYRLYDDYINHQCNGSISKLKKYDDYLNYSIGFTTRGCFRKCPFCVNRKYDRVFKHSPIEEFLDDERAKIYLWDDNIMASPDFIDIITELQATGKPFQFRQGLDIRLLTDAKAECLAKSRYHGDFIFAFDHIEDADLITRKLALWRKHCMKSTKLYVLVGYDGQDEKDIENAFERIRILMTFGCKPFIMKYEDYNNSPYKAMYVNLARWCNQPALFRKNSFRQFCLINERCYLESVKQTNHHCSCYQAMLDFEEKFPDIAARYFDIRFDDLNQYDKEKIITPISNTHYRSDFFQTYNYTTL